MNETYDVVVIGAGIHGAGVAQAAAAAGHSVLVLERSGIASGTSSRSSKLIHGGLRYLESRQFDLVRECLRERALLLNLAPELVRLVPFFIPIYRETRRRPWQLRIGLGVYRWLSADPSGRYATVARNRWHTLDGLSSEGLTHVFRYQDAQTDDAVLTGAVVRAARTLGAELKMPASFLCAELESHGCLIEYEHNGAKHCCRAKVLVNAAGPAVNKILTHCLPQPAPKAVELVQGTHIILDTPFRQGCYYVEAPHDGRAVFVMPWQGERLLIGTTEVGIDEGAEPTPTEGEIAYLQETASHYFPALGNLPVADAFAGARVLPHGDNRAFSRPRDTRLVTDRETQPRLLTIYGGKLTAYRLTAEKVMANISSSLPDRKPIADTRTMPLRPED
ncbi:MAG: FAD-dependent oxidoreductase [Gammaproteobacteria bacterium]|nr:FAD-dependent oxidoreductase [Gammaproteobacteria bacterium]